MTEPSKKRRSVRLYPPVESAWQRLQRELGSDPGKDASEENFNYTTNVLFAEKLGVNPEVIDAYRRQKSQ